MELDESVESVADCLAPGDELECVRLPTFAEIMGRPGVEHVRMGVGDTVELDDFGGRAYSIEYRASSSGQLGYWVNTGTGVQGPLDGTSIRVLPFQTFFHGARNASGSVVMLHRVHDGPAVRYVRPGAQMAGNAFSAPAEIPELAPYQLAEGDLPWLEGTGGSVTSSLGWLSVSGSVPVAEGVWIRVPAEVGTVRWIQQP
ncbi:MAG: hypothetical protein JNL97_11725 [Verrucomicrobiales bacterium]|nr:hypothetical protein [Verrucomicrobiales bacterium]